jgi:hypothetical protein
MLLRFPLAMSRMKKFLIGKASFGNDWPDWCGLPMSATYAILTDGVPEAEAPQTLQKFGIDSLSKLTAALLWTQTKAVYRFDPYFTAEIAASKPVGDLPIEVLCRLPFHCVFIETPTLPPNEAFRGFFAWMEYDVNNKMPELRLTFLRPDNTVYTGCILLPGGDLDTSQAALVQSGKNRFEKHKEQLEANEFLQEMNEGRILPPETTTAALNLVLYLCASETDVVCASRPRPTIKKGDIPLRHATWDVGVRIGSALRRHQATTSTPAAEPSTRNSLSPRPHVRRAHWHHYWTGPREGERQLQLRWIHPVLVDKIIGDIPTVIHKAGVE